VLRSVHGRVFWSLLPNAPLEIRLSTGTRLLLEKEHSFTHCFWPDVDHFEPDVRAALRYFLKPGDTFVDCGANIGYWSVFAAGIVGEKGAVVSIEANPDTFKLLQRNLGINQFGEALNCAVTSKPGQFNLFVPREGGDVYSSLKIGGLVREAGTESYQVEGRTLDDIVTALSIKKIKLVKIDVEGAEMDVLRASGKILNDIRPILIVEYGMNTWPIFNSSAQDLQKFIAEKKYRCWLYNIEGQNLREPKQSDWDSPYTNLVLVPQELAL